MPSPNACPPSPRGDRRGVASAVASAPPPVAPRPVALRPVAPRLRRLLPVAGLVGPLLGTAVLVAAAGPLIVPQGVPQGAVVRFRVVANSNRLTDQRDKLRVRDAVLAAITPVVERGGSAAQMVGWLEGELPRIRRVARAAAPAGEAVRVALGPDAFPNRWLAGLFYPRGRYETLLVTLGAGAGHNWWTVLFPPFAFVRVGGHLSVVGPSGAASTPPGAAPAGHGPAPRAVPDDSIAAAPVRVRFALWDAWLGLRARAAGAAAAIDAAMHP
jgi:stage II sporulation protein R